MKALLLALCLSATLILAPSALVHADDPPADGPAPEAPAPSEDGAEESDGASEGGEPESDVSKPKNTSSFDVFEYLRIVNRDGQDVGENIAENIQREAEENQTSVAGALLLRAINILSLLVGTFAMLMLMYGGFTFITSGGDEGRTDKGKAVIGQAIGGLAIALMSYIIVTVVLSFFF